MARPREFDVDDALDRAMNVFWAKGYEATSMSDLMAAMDLSKSSLYDTFGSKHELFLSALQRYKRQGNGTGSRRGRPERRRRQGRDKGGVRQICRRLRR